MGEWAGGRAPAGGPGVQARELDDGDERNSMRAVMLWALTEFIRTLDEGSWRLTMPQREHATRMGLLHLQA